MTLRIGYLIQQFPPEVGAGAARASEMAVRWQQAGAHVTVLTGMPNRPQGRIHPDYRGRLSIREDWNDITVVRSWLYVSPTPSFARTVLNNMSFMMTSALSGALHAEAFDVLIASSPPLLPHVAGDLVARGRRIPLVLEVRDLWPDYLVDMGLLKEGTLASRSILSLERYLLRRANSVTVVTESFRQRMIEKGVDAGRIDILPNGVDTTFYRHSRTEPPLPALRRTSPGEFLIGYLGNFGAGQSLSDVLDAAALVGPANPRIRFVLAGDGPQGGALRARLATRPIANVSIHEPIAKELTPAFYSSCDACVVPLAPVAAFQKTVPSKIFEIMACEIPVIASVDGEARRIVEQSQSGVVTRPGNARELADAVVGMFDTSVERRAAMGTAGRAYVGVNYSRVVIADRYLELLHRVAGR